MTHTPTPWHILREADGAIAIGNRSLPHVAVVRYSHNPALSKETGEANASHIVKCVNLHDELVEVFELLIDNISPEAWEALPQYVQEQVMRVYNNAKGEAAHA